MADVQLFSNNAQGELSVELAADGTAIDLVSSAMFHAPTAGQYELATLRNADKTIFEIVKITANSVNTITVVRTPEGGTGLVWPAGTIIEGYVTAGTLSQFPQGFDNGGDVRGAGAVNLQPGRDDPAHAATGDSSIAVGYDAWAASMENEAIGLSAWALGSQNSAARGGITNRLRDTAMEGRFPAVKMAEDDAGFEVVTNASSTFLFSSYVDLGVPPAWQANTAYNHGDIIQPTVPNGKQYRLAAPDDLTNPVIKQICTTGATEPSPWMNGPFDGDCNWVELDLSVGYFMQPVPLGAVFLPLRFGFLCHDTFSALTGTPVVSIGDVNSTTTYINGQNVNITQPHECCLFTGAPTIALVGDANRLSFTLDAAATAGRCVGRFFAEGIFVELPVHN